MADPVFSPGVEPTPEIAIIFQIFAENSMKMKEFGPPGGGRASLAPPLDPPMLSSPSKPDVNIYNIWWDSGKNTLSDHPYSKIDGQGKSFTTK